MIIFSSSISDFDTYEAVMNLFVKLCALEKQVVSLTISFFLYVLFVLVNRFSRLSENGIC